MSKSSVKTLLINLAVASLPVFTYAATDWILDSETPSTEAKPDEAAGVAGSDSPHGREGGPADEGPGRHRQSTLVPSPWLKLDTIETMQRASRLAKPSDLISGGPDGNAMALGELLGQSSVRFSAPPWRPTVPQPALTLLAPAVHAHAPPLGVSYRIG